MDGPAPRASAADGTESRRAPRLPELSVIVPTYDERANVRPLVDAVAAALPGIAFEVVFVDDDSRDRTWEEVERVAVERDDVRLIHRIGRRGLSSAVLEGMLAARGEFVAVIDGDLQHDERILPEMLRRARAGVDVVVGSRYCAEGGVGEWDERRRRLSRWATTLARRVLPQPVADPMSGFFLCRREVAREAARRVSPRGFKILAEILASGPELTTCEVPYVFRPRTAGASKLTASVALEYGDFLYERTFGRFIPLRFAKYCAVGAMGTAVQTGVLYAAWKGLGFDRTPSLLAGIEAAVIFNFLLNNRWTFREYFVRGGAAVPVFLRYNAVCAIGALSSFSVSLLGVDHGVPPEVAFPVGAAVGACWNYTMATTFTWRAAG